MALEGVQLGSELLARGDSASEAIVDIIKAVENYPYYKSVGYGGLPNEHGEVELDAGYMDGDTFDIGAVASIKGIKNPIAIAKELSKEKFNNILVGKGAQEYALEHGFTKKNLLTNQAKEFWMDKLEEIKATNNLVAYDGHDTVGVVTLDMNSKICVGTSTSGLFMKKRGRVGDSPLVGSGFYADSDIGGATSTGLGEDIMKCCMSYQVVSLMELGMSPQEAVDKVIHDYDRKMIKKRGQARAASIVCMNKNGEWGVGTNVEFSFVAATRDQKPSVYVANNVDGKTIYKKATKEWLEDYARRVKTEIL
ncbi:N(4)-(beta-N-acetylglucosaminyl)-L-asparaginase [Clostridiaceae bacterium M8S5]|nr:N(4)-(beta-N-acetylglucosaminyl)-L-asparaginase [Clostridiaceae bacterium M8S5]